MPWSILHSLADAHSTSSTLPQPLSHLSSLEDLRVAKRHEKEEPLDKCFSFCFAVCFGQLCGFDARCRESTRDLSTVNDAPRCRGL